VSTVTTLFSLVGRKKKEGRVEADSEVGCLKQIIKEKYSNPRHASSPSTLKAMHQLHILDMRRSVTCCVVIHENGKGAGGLTLRTVHEADSAHRHSVGLYAANDNSIPGVGQVARK
jgi:hypothetical protein